MESSAREAASSPPALQLPQTDTDDGGLCHPMDRVPAAGQIATEASRLRYHVRRWTARLSRT